MYTIFPLSWVWIGSLKGYMVGDFKGLLNTKDVILTHERLRHITERHADVKWNSSTIVERLADMIRDPDAVYADDDKTKTVLYLKYFDGKPFQAIVRLSMGKEDGWRQNSILTFYGLNPRTFQQLAAHSLLYKKGVL